VRHFDPLGLRAPSWSEGDFNGDDRVDIADFNVIAMFFAPSGYLPPGTLLSRLTGPVLPQELSASGGAVVDRSSLNTVVPHEASETDSLRDQEKFGMRRESSAVDLAFADSELQRLRSRRKIHQP
ncbi:MAG: hypothetical protein MK179_19595, partial [Pirellulaceae bacterium]|nr:hypothetical protein [Pirellulaceae bacterium]